MSFKEFDIDEIENVKNEYEAEVRTKWEGTKEYKESRIKTGKYTGKEWKAIIERSDNIIKQFSKHIGEDPSSEIVQQLVEVWKKFITTYYYECSNEILSYLGKMYISDERFKKTLDKYRTGTADLISRAIEFYCVEI